MPTAPASLSALLFRYIGFFLLGVLTLLLTNLLGFMVPKLIGWFIDALGSLGTASGNTPGNAVPPLTGGSLFQVALALVASWAQGFRHWVDQAARHAPHLVAMLTISMATGAGLMRVASRLAIFHAGRRIEHDLRRDLFSHLLLLAPSFFRRTPVGEILSRATNDLTAIRVVFGPGVLNVVNTLLVYTVGVTLLVRIDSALALWALLPYPVVLLLVRRLTRKIYDLSSDVQARLGELSQQAQETLANIQVVQIYGRNADRGDAYEKIGANYVHANLALTRNRGYFGPLIGLISGLGLLVTLWLGGRRVMSGALTLGQFVEFQGYVLMLSWPTMAMGWVLSLWQRGRAALDRINQILLSEPTLADPPKEQALVPNEQPQAHIQLHNLAVFRGDTKVLSGIELDIPSGSVLGVIGATGSGKSTLAEAIARMQEVPQGTLFLDGQDVTRLPLSFVRNTIGYAQQEPFLFSDTLRENLNFAQSAKDDAAILKVAEQVQLAEEIATMPKGLDTEVGERGIQLSGGQRQRVALARALLYGPSVLVLDDALSAVDASTEAKILGTLAELLKGRTAVIVSHRVAAVQMADRIIVLERGRIAETGTHEELLAKGGLYTNFARLQRLRKELDEESAG